MMDVMHGMVTASMDYLSGGLEWTLLVSPPLQGRSPGGQGAGSNTPWGSSEYRLLLEGSRLA